MVTEENQLVKEIDILMEWEGKVRVFRRKRPDKCELPECLSDTYLPCCVILRPVEWQVISRPCLNSKLVKL